MKKISVLVLCIVLAFSLVLTGCQSSEAKLDAIVEEARGQIDALEAQFGGIMEIDISARNGSLVYTYKYVDDIGDDELDVMKEYLASSMDAQASVFESAAAELRSAGVKDATVIVEYLTNSGDMIYSQEFE